MVKLRDCPFCNSGNIEYMESSGLSWYQCLRCSAEGPVAGRSEDALKFWNGDFEIAAASLKIAVKS